MSVLHRTYIWLCRFRHRRGYGVHSPFAFNFITGVVYEKGVYYAYRELESTYGMHVNGLARLLQRKKACDCRMARLLFRISNYVHPDCILLGEKTADWVCGYMAAGSRSAECHYLSNRKTDWLKQFGGKTLLVYFSDTDTADLTWNGISTIVAEASVIVIAGIHADKKAALFWEKFQGYPEVGITFDLYDCGVAFLDRTRYKQHYIVNF